MDLDNAMLTAYAVKRDDGTVDIETTTAKFHSQLVKMVNLREHDLVNVGVHVDKLYDGAAKGAWFPTGWITTQVIHSMGVNNEAYTAMEARILDYLQSNAGNAEATGKLFLVKKGKGYSRRRDIA